MKNLLLISYLLLICLTITSCSSESAEDASKLVESKITLRNLKSIEIEILELINNYRLTKDLPALAANEQIRSQTANHTNYMIINNSASHDNFFIRKEYLQTYAGAEQVSENVAAGFTNAQSVVNAWINSESHRLNIEGDHTHFNISAEKNKGGKWYFTNIFMKTNN